MNNLTGKLEAYFITNGRSTSPYAEEALRIQKYVKFKITVHKDMDWLTANTRILETCESKFFLRVDDDMILNPHAVRFMWYMIKDQPSKVAMKGCKLWEPYSSKIIKGIKIYNTAIAKDIGFRISKIGKIDKLFTADARKKRKKVRYTDDVVGIHACASFDEHLKYALMRGEHKGPDFQQERVWMKQHIKGYGVSLEKQAEMANKFIWRMNKRNKSTFFKFVRENQNELREPQNESNE